MNKRNDYSSSHEDETSCLVVQSAFVCGIFLLKFDVTGVNSQTVTNAKLCLYNTDGANAGGKFYSVTDNTWQEETVTWSNAPTAGTTMLAELGPVSPNTWYEADLTSHITADGTYSLRISDSVGAAYRI